MDILIGATGCIGSHVAAALADAPATLSPHCAAPASARHPRGTARQPATLADPVAVCGSRSCSHTRVPVVPDRGGHGKDALQDPDANVPSRSWRS
jgi:uncharacterized protein YbjT (DUF2867 family)